MASVARAVKAVASVASMGSTKPESPDRVEWLGWLDTCSANDHTTTVGAASVGAGLAGCAGRLGSMKSSPLQSYTHRVGTRAAQRVTAAELHAEGASTRTRDSAW